MSAPSLLGLTARQADVVRILRERGSMRPSVLAEHLWPMIPRYRLTGLHYANAEMIARRARNAGANVHRNDLGEWEWHP